MISIEILLLFVFLLIIVTILLFKKVLQIQLEYDSNETDFNITLLWLDPLIKAFVAIEDSTIFLHVYLFKKLVLKRSLKRDKQKGSGLKYLKLFNLKDVNVYVNYGCNDPFSTGIACGVINLASEFVNIDYIEQTPNFLANNDYLSLQATANVNLGSALLKMIR